MFKKDISPGSKSKVKSSVQRAIRTQLTTTYPLLTPHIDEIIPKKEQLDAMKIPDRVTLYLIGSTPIFYQHMTDALLPHLKLVHRFPTCFPSIRIDRGAIRFVLSGATLMAPGLTSTGGRLPNGNAEEEGVYGETGEGEGWGIGKGGAGGDLCGGKGRGLCGGVVEYGDEGGEGEGEGSGGGRCALLGGWALEVEYGLDWLNDMFGHMRELARGIIK
ncbi:translation machinery-associated 20 protein [Rutstroemia sp. NJR-2017a BBW]|nr:translation machinery-associated 20 protein [Rutstroemia sp. NJR-2017a BBW]